MDYVSYIVKKATVDELKVFYNPKVINKFCSECNKYSKVWSCPPLSFNDIDYVSKYKYCYVISGKIYINKVPKNELSQIVSHALNKYSDISNGKDDFSNIFNGLYYSFREFNDSQILRLEDKFDNSVTLASGRCLVCSICTRSAGEPCISPHKLRYSLEGLGFDVSGIIENIIGEKIQWSSDTQPEYVTCVSALLSNEDINSNRILSVLNTSNVIK